jgi:hypothetical protein
VGLLLTAGVGGEDLKPMGSSVLKQNVRKLTVLCRMGSGGEGCTMYRERRMRPIFRSWRELNQECVCHIGTPLESVFKFEPHFRFR